jgi:lipopolysaccharide biosynthesis protein
MKDTPQLIAIYFPQFHNIPENDEWWGKNFTDWELVKSAKPLFDGHNQPRIPLNENYYNPCQKAVLAKQIEQAKEYGIGGFMFYHYWFDGRLILEKPLEVFLNNSDLDMPFCLSWANNSWTRQWKANNEFLLEQKHIPNKELWEKHFNYLLPFFKDKRHLKIEDKIVFVVNTPEIIRQTKEMFDYWNELALKNGLNGIYLIASKHYDYIKHLFLDNYNAIIKIHPREANNSNKNPDAHKILRLKWFRELPEFMQNTLRQWRLKYKKLTLIDSVKIWKHILSNAYVNDYPEYNLKVFEAVYFDWDNTARYANRATVYTPLTKEQKYDYMQQLIAKTKEHDCPYIFFNAWNEWSEGTYLEPDKKDGFENLEIIRNLFK